MKARDYPVSVWPLSDDDGIGFIAIAPDLPGCSAQPSGAASGPEGASVAFGQAVIDAQIAAAEAGK